jgi:acetyl esterase
MTEAAAAKGSLKTWGRHALLLLAGVVILAAAALTLGAFVPSIPYVGLFGSAALSVIPAWVAVAAIAAGLAARASARGRTRTFLPGLAAIAAVGALVVIVRLVVVASANDVQLGVGAPFGSGGVLSSSPPDATRVYTRAFDEDLKIHAWRPKGAAPRGGWPIVIYVHGGGWNSGNSVDRGADMRWFADRGWLALSIDYSLSSEKRHMWNEVHGQIGCALAWTNKNGAAWSGDVSRIALFGESAGGNLVLNAGNLAGAGKLVSSCGGEVPNVRAVSAIYPAADIAAVWNNDYAPSGAGVRRMAEQYTGGSPKQFPDRYAATAATTHLGPNAPPTILFISENDHLVPVASMKAYEAASRRAGIETRSIHIPYGEHGFDLIGVGNAIARQATLQFLAKEMPTSPGARAPN